MTNSLSLPLKKKDQISGIVLLSLACLVWTVMESMAIFIFADYTPFQVVWVRYATHILLMLAVFSPRHQLNLIKTHRWRLQCFRPLLMIGMPLFFIASATLLSENDVMSIFWLTPLLMAGLAAILLKEQVSRNHWLILIAGVLGTFLIFHPDNRLLSWRILLPLGMAFCFSLYLVLTRILRTERTLTNLFYTALIVLLPWSLGLPFFWRSLTLRAALVMVTIGLLGYLTLYLFDKACEQAPISVLAPFVNCQAVFALLVHAILLGHLPGRSMILGCLVLIATWMAFLTHKPRSLPVH